MMPVRWFTAGDTELECVNLTPYLNTTQTPDGFKRKSEKKIAEEEKRVKPGTS